jgi:hypothetical protein
MTTNSAGLSADGPLTERIEQIRALSRAMLEAAQRGEWQELLELEAARHTLLGPLLATPWRDGPLVPLAKEILASDRAVLALAEPARQQLEQELAELAQGRRALRAYGACRGGVSLP